MAESMYMILVALFFFWMCKESTLAYAMGFGALLVVVVFVVLLYLSGTVKYMNYFSSRMTGKANLQQKAWKNFKGFQRIIYLRTIGLNLLNFRLREPGSAPKSAPRTPSWPPVPPQ